MKTTATLVILICLSVFTAFGQQPQKFPKNQVSQESDDWPTSRKYSKKDLKKYNEVLEKRAIAYEINKINQANNSAVVLSPVGTCNIITCGGFGLGDTTPDSSWGGFKFAPDGSTYAANVKYSCWHDVGTVDYSEGQYISYSNTDANIDTPGIISPSPDGGGFAIFSYKNESIDQDLTVLPNTNYTVCFEIAVMPRYSNNSGNFSEYEPNLMFGIGSGGTVISDPLTYTHNDLTPHTASEFPASLSTATTGPFQNPGGWTEIDPFWETICITFKSDASGTVNVFYTTGNPGKSIVVVDGLRLSLEGYAVPPTFTSTVENTKAVIVCDSKKVDLDDYISSTGPSGSVLTWSTNSDPLVVADHLSDSNITPPGTYFAFYYNHAEDCASPVAQLDLIVSDFNAKIVSHTDIDCEGDSTGSISATGIDGTPPYQYSIDGGSNYQNDGTFTGLVSGNYTITVMDANGCSLEASITLDDIDTEDPSITAPDDYTIEGCDTTVITSLIYSETSVEITLAELQAAEALDGTASDDVAIDTITYIDETTSSTSCATEVKRTFTVTDKCGNSSSDVQLISIVDTTAPSFVETLPSDIDVECDAVPTAAILTATDNCDANVNVIFNETREDGNCDYNYILTRTWTVTDDCGNENKHNQTITVTDTSSPTFTAPGDIEIFTDADCAYDATVAVTGDVTDEADNCSTGLDATFVDTIVDGSCEGTYVITRTWSLSDNCGNPADDQVQTITVSDNTAPTFTAPSDIEIFTDADCAYDATVAVTGDVTDEADNCSTGLDATFVDTIVDGSCEGTYVITRTWSLSDNCGNPADDQVQTITVSDNTAPTFTAPSYIEIFTDADCAYDATVAVTGDVTDEADNCSAGLDATYTDSISDGPCEGTYAIIRTWSLVDDCGNAAVDQLQTIVVSDNIKPTFSAPGDIEIFTDADCAYDATVAVTGDVTDEADNCSTGLDATFVDTIVDGSCEGTYVITRTWSLSDNCGNPADDQVQTITVSDNTAPTFTAPGDIEIFTDADCAYDAAVAVTGDVTDEADNCSTGLDATFVDTIIDGSCEGTYVITRTWSLSDNCGNPADDQVQTITVSDNTAPTFTAPGDIEIFTDADCAYDATVAVTGDVTDEADNCSTGLDATFVDTIVDGSCEGTYVITRTWSLSDNCGNPADDQVQTITVSDNTAPTFTAPGDIEIFTDADCAYDATVAVTGDVTDEADNCSTGLDATFVDTIVDGSCEGTYVITRTWSLSDNCGNPADDQVQTITVSDNTAPTFTAPSDIEIFTDADCAYDATVAVTGDVTDEADNCSTGLDATFVDTIVDGSCEGTYVITRTWSLSDNCGNPADDQVQTITVSDNTAPTFTAPGDIEIFTDADCAYDAAVAVTGDVTDEADNCSTGLDATFVDTIVDGSCEGTYVITRTWSLSDNCGNPADDQVQTITVSDNTAPTFTAPGDIEIFTDADCAYDATVAVTGDVTDEADNCSTGLDATFVDTIVDGSCEGTYVITRTWSLSDNCGNPADDQVQTITVSDNTAPTFTAPGDIEIFTDADCAYDATVAVTGDVTDEADNCSTGYGCYFR